MHLKVSEKNTKTLSSGQKNPKKPKKTQKTQKTQKKQKKPKKTHWAGFFKKKPGFFQPCRYPSCRTYAGRGCSAKSTVHLVRVLQIRIRISVPPDLKHW